MSVNDAFSPEDTLEIWLDSFLALFDLFCCQSLDLAPPIVILLREVVRVLPLVKRSNLLLFFRLSSKDRFHFVLDQLCHEILSLISLPRLPHKVLWEDQLWMVQYSVVNQWVLPNRCH